MISFAKWFRSDMETYYSNRHVRMSMVTKCRLNDRKCFEYGDGGGESVRDEM